MHTYFIYGQTEGRMDARSYSCTYHERHYTDLTDRQTGSQPDRQIDRPPKLLPEPTAGSGMGCPGFYRTLNPKP